MQIDVNPNSLLFGIVQQYLLPLHYAKSFLTTIQRSAQLGKYPRDHDILDNCNVHTL